MSSFSKKVLIEQTELDRLQQRQLREYSPELQAMVRLINNMMDITENKKLNAEERLNTISGLQIQFDKLKTKNWIVKRRNSTSGRSRGTVGGSALAAKCFSRQRYKIGNRAGKRGARRAI